MPKLIRNAASVWCSLLATFILLDVAAIGQEPPKQVVRDLNPIQSLPRVVDLKSADSGETAERVRSLLHARQGRRASENMLRRAPESEPDAVLAIDSPNGLIVASPVPDEVGRLLRESTDGSKAVQFAVMGADRTLDLEISGDPEQEKISKLVIRDADTGGGLEFNLTDGKLYQLSAGTSANTTAPSGTVSCILNQLGDMAKPCNATLLLATGAACIAGIAALPATAGLSAVVALPACGAFIEKVAEAFACAGYDCGLQAALNATNSIAADWITAPPATVVNGQTVNIWWKLSTLNPLGVPLNSTRIIGSTSADPKTYPLFASNPQGGGSITPYSAYSYMANVQMPSATFANGTKIYWVVEAVSGTTKYYSSVVSSTVNNPTPNPGTGTTINFSGSVSMGGWWQQSITVPSGRTLLRVQVGWSGGADLDLHLYGPNSMHIGFGGSSNGYSGYSTNPEWIQVNAPPAGSYTIKINGWYVPGSSTSFSGTYLIQ